MNASPSYLRSPCDRAPYAVSADAPYVQVTSRFPPLRTVSMALGLIASIALFVLAARV